MRVAVITAFYNEAHNITRLIEAVLKQTHLPDELILVDDGSNDNSAALIKPYVENHPIIKYIYQANTGPAGARNKAWRSATSEICLFTDGDCVPEPDWIELMLVGFDSDKIGATAGRYKTMNPENLLARFVGLEIDWRYQNVSEFVDCHGAYNLAIRKSVLEDIGGYKENYKKPSGEDWDLTYSISREHKIRYIPQSVVGHYHPEKFLWYMRNQLRRAYDRIRIYKDHPEKRSSDTYTGSFVKYQILGAGFFLFTVFLGFLQLPFAFSATRATFIFLILSTLIPFPYFLKRDKAVAFYSLFVQFLRFFAWFGGAILGTLRFGLKLKTQGKT